MPAEMPPIGDNSIVMNKLAGNNVVGKGLKCFIRIIGEDANAELTEHLKIDDNITIVSTAIFFAINDIQGRFLNRTRPDYHCRESKKRPTS
jgi:hypothetical protein